MTLSNGRVIAITIWYSFISQLHDITSKPWAKRNQTQTCLFMLIIIIIIAYCLFISETQKYMHMPILIIYNTEL